MWGKLVEGDVHCKMKGRLGAVKVGQDLLVDEGKGDEVELVLPKLG